MCIHSNVCISVTTVCSNADVAAATAVNESAVTIVLQRVHKLIRDTKRTHERRLAHSRASLQTMRRNAAGVSLLLVCAYIVCWMPYNLVAVWISIDPGGFAVKQDYIAWLTALIVLNSVLNPLLYGTVDMHHNHHRPPVLV